MRNIARVNKPINIPLPKASFDKPFMKHELSLLEFTEILGIALGNKIESKLCIRSNCFDALVKIEFIEGVGDVVRILGNEFSWFTVRYADEEYDYSITFNLINENGELKINKLPYVVNGMFKVFDGN